MRNERRNTLLARREFLGHAALAPLALALGCRTPSSRAEVEHALTNLIMALGPWPEGQRARARQFAQRFLQARVVSGTFHERSTTATALASAAPFRNQPMAIGTIDLSGRSEAQRRLIVELAEQVYSLSEIVCQLAGTPGLGNCTAGRVQYTRPPSEWAAPYRRR